LSTNESKRGAIEALALAIEREILPDRTLLAELKAFQAERFSRDCSGMWPRIG